MLTYQVCVSVWAFYGFPCYFLFPVSCKGRLRDNVSEPDALFSHIIEGSDDEAIPSSCCEQEIKLMEALDKEYSGFR